MPNYNYLRWRIICITNAVRKGSQNLGNKKPIKYVFFFFFSASIDLQIGIVIIFLTKCGKEKWIVENIKCGLLEIINDG